MVSRNVLRSVISSGIRLRMRFRLDDFLLSSWNGSSVRLRRYSAVNGRRGAESVNWFSCVHITLRQHQSACIRTCYHASSMSARGTNMNRRPHELTNSIFDMGTLQAFKLHRLSAIFDSGSRNPLLKYSHMPAARKGT